METRESQQSRLNALQAAPLGVVKVPAGQAAPEPSTLPVPDVPAYANEVKPPEEHQTVADRLTYLCDILGATHSRRISPDDGQTLLAVTWEGNTLAGKGATTAEAFDALLTKVQAYMAATAEAE